jgi:hypothetical protein
MRLAIKLPSNLQAFGTCRFLESICKKKVRYRFVDQPEFLTVAVL